ncbi:MAG: methyltransferase [Candidatus Thermoplasmatota archaeon]|nr:methyltransferase [Candidatus Thermoplasmatota archaeon]
MELKTTADINRFLRSYLASAALGTALEHRLFWRLADDPASATRVAEELNIPQQRCRCWLELLVGLGLLERRGETYAPSSVARDAIIGAYTPETWSFLAREARERYPSGTDLITHISHPESVWVAQGLKAPDYVNQMIENPERAGQFTRMLYELHGPLAEKLAENLDLGNVSRLLDLGGGSGVVSLALLRSHPNLTAVVVDIENVCKVGREIAAGTSEATRITYEAADFTRNEIPAGFDLILECDVGIYTVDLFRKLRTALNPKGRLIIVDWLERPGQELTLQRLVDRFMSSLGAPGFTTLTVAEVRDRLVQSDYRQVTELTLETPAIHEASGIVGPVILQAHR